MPQSFVQKLSTHLVCKASDERLVKLAKAQLKCTEKQIRADWNRVRTVLRNVLPVYCGMAVGVVQKNQWFEWFCSSEPGTVAYVSLTRTCYQWNNATIPSSPVPRSPEELALVQLVEAKILELGFVLKCDPGSTQVDGAMISRSDGNLTIWRLSLP